MSATALGAFLRARRERLRPDDVGLAWSGRRRVPGLRREELAMLAGVSPDYNLRLEQGRDLHPSAAVLDALARALQLDDEAIAHLHALAIRRAGPSPDLALVRAAPHVERLISTWSRTPAFIHTRFMDVLAANALMTAVTPVVRVGANLIHATFLEPEIRDNLDEWEAVAAINVGRLRSMAGAHLDHPRLAELVDEVSAQSPEFRELWARHDVVVTEPDRYKFDHPVVGRLELYPALLAVVGGDGQYLVCHCAEPGSSSERALETLATMTRSDDRPGVS
jgi:transcriptional regulator with XRE-family HTH domain